jgi:hypothetical protein
MIIRQLACIELLGAVIAVVIPVNTTHPNQRL